jgi:hypothetical protein
VLFHSNIASLDASVLNEVTGEEKSLMIASCTWDVDFVSIYGDSCNELVLAEPVMVKNIEQ